MQLSDQEDTVTKERKIPASDEAWDGGELGRDEDFARVATDVDEEAINASMALTPITIRLQKSLIDDFKRIAKQHGIGYQPLMRQVLTRFAVHETRQMANDLLRERAKLEKEAKAAREPKPRKRA
jgi:predicted DNA binding CopG/RHH family protein